jgi:hypothetical protein
VLVCDCGQEFGSADVDKTDHGNGLSMVELQEYLLDYRQFLSQHII